MTIAFHDVSVGAYRQILPGVVATLDKAAAHFAAEGIDREAMFDVALAPDMLPLRFQVRSVVHHSAGALAGLRSGRFAPPTPIPQRSWDALRDLVAATAAEIEAIPREEIEGLATREVLFSAGERRRLFTGVEFVLGFSVPNLHFHAATAYDILRMKGVPLQKPDFLGRLPGRRPETA